MLPKIIRFDLRRHRNFFSDAKIIRTPHLTVFYQSIETPLLRAAVIVKKRSGKAVQRAKIRRTLRAALAQLWKTEKMLFEKQIGIAVLPRGPLQSLEQYVSEIREALSQI